MTEFKRARACNSGACVEVAVGPTAVQVRDAAGSVLEVSRSSWAALTEGVKAGEFDLLEQ